MFFTSFRVRNTVSPALVVRGIWARANWSRWHIATRAVERSHVARKQHGVVGCIRWPHRAYGSGAPAASGSAALKVSDVTTQSYAAYEHYQRAWEALQRFAYPAAGQELEQAVAIDPGSTEGHGQSARRVSAVP